MSVLWKEVQWNQFFYSVQEEIEKLKTVGMLEGKMTPDSYQKIKKYLFVKPLNKKNHSLEMEDAVHEDVGDIACVLYMMLSNTNEYFTDIKIKNQHLEQWEMTKEAVIGRGILKILPDGTPSPLYKSWERMGEPFIGEWSILLIEK